MSGLRTLHRLRKEARDGAQDAFVRRLAELRLRGELEALAFGRDIARRELDLRLERADEARNVLERVEASLAVLERLLERMDNEARHRRLRREERAQEDCSTHPDAAQWTA